MGTVPVFHAKGAEAKEGFLAEAAEEAEGAKVSCAPKADILMGELFREGMNGFAVVRSIPALFASSAASARTTSFLTPRLCASARTKSYFTSSGSEASFGAGAGVPRKRGAGAGMVMPPSSTNVPRAALCG